MIQVRQILAPEPALIPALSALLMDSVHHGASVGFLAPLPLTKARAYWEPVLDAAGPSLGLWVAEEEGQLLGSVQLARGQRENGRHRAELQKLFVASQARGRGIARILVEAAETHARTLGCTLLLLDTQTGSPAESIYSHWGWQKAGEIPDYAASPDGQLHPSSYFFKLLN